MRKSALILIIALLLVSAMIVGCGKASEDGNTENGTDNVNVTPIDVGSPSDPISNEDVDTGSLY